MIERRGNSMIAGVLAARDAARRMATRRTRSCTPRALPKPLTLRWRRERRPAAALGGRVVAGPTVQWFAQYHFHSTAPWRPARMHAASSRAAAAGVSQQTRYLVMRVGAPRRDATSPGRALLTREIVHVSVGRTRLPPRAKLNASAHAFAPISVARSDMLYAIRHSRSIELRRVADGARAKGPRPAGTPRSRSLGRVHAHSARVQTSFATASNVDSARTARAPQRVAMRHDGGEVLVWRRAARSAIVVGEDTPTQHVESTRNTASHATASGAAATVAQEHVTRPAAFDFARLDPSFVDRLSDDVIRRVERRIRIDRERRGF
jgi:hypothetical protein